MWAQSRWRLDLGESERLSDEAGVELARCRALRDVDVGFSGIGDATVDALISLPELEILDIAYTRVTDAGLRAIADSELFSRLRSLRLAATRVTADGLRAFAASPRATRLERLDLRGWTDLIIDDELDALLAARFGDAIQT